MPNKVMGAMRAMLRRGFVGPRYSGITGRLRFIWHEMVARTDVMVVCTPDRAVPAEGNGRYRLLIIQAVDGAAPHRETLSREIGEQRLSSWLEPLSWGEHLHLLEDEGRVVAYRWVQYGNNRGFPYYAGWLFDGECRVNRGGVFFNERRKGYNTVLHKMMLGNLFAQGATRIFCEMSADNVANRRSVAEAGYAEYARLKVLGPMLGGFIRWQKREESPTDPSGSVL